MSQPTLHSLIRRKLRNRILMALAILVASVVVVSVIEAGLSFADLRRSLDSRAHDLQDLVISEVLVNNPTAIQAIIDEDNRQQPHEPVSWYPDIEFSADQPFAWKFPAFWKYQVSLRKISDQNFGVFEFRGNLLTTGALLASLSYRLAAVFLVCILMAFILYPVAAKIPNELILRPIRELLHILKTEGFPTRDQTFSGFVEITSIRRDFFQLMEDKRRLEDERIEMQRMLTVTQTAQMIAHDMRKPFGLLKMVLESLSTATSVEDVRDLTETALPGLRRSVTQLDAMLNELVSVGADNMMATEAFDIRQVIESAVQSSLALHGPRKIPVKYTFDHDHAIRGDAILIERVVGNIVQNALQSMRATDRLWATTRSVVLNNAIYVETCIGNSGTFISESEIRKIFELFYTSGKQGGTGLGLAIAQKIIRNHDGTIWCESDPVEGTRFFFRIPASTAIESGLPGVPSSAVLALAPSYQVGIQTYVTEQKADGASKQPSNRTATILIADDEAIYRNALADNIRSCLGTNRSVDIVEAETPDEAVRLAIAMEPDIIFLDVDFHNDGSNGFSVAAQLRARDCQSVICFHTNHPEDSVRQRSVAAGVVFAHCLPKPVPRSHLAGILSTTFKRGPTLPL